MSAANSVALDCLAVTGAELEHNAAQAAAKLKAALLAGGGTAEARAAVEVAQTALLQHQQQLAALAAEAEAGRRQALSARGEELARSFTDRLRLQLATLAPPRRPAAARGTP